MPSTSPRLRHQAISEADQRAITFDRAVFDAEVNFRSTRRYDGPIVAAGAYAEAMRAARSQYKGAGVRHPGLTRAQLERFYEAAR